MYSQLRRKWTGVLSPVNIQFRDITVGTPDRHDRQMYEAATNLGREDATQVPIFIYILSLYSKV